MKMLIDWIL